MMHPQVKVLVGIVLPEAGRKVGLTSHGTQERANHDASSAQPASRQSHAAATRPAVPDGAAKSDIDVAALMERMASMRIRTEATHEELKAGLEAAKEENARLKDGLEEANAKNAKLESALPMSTFDASMLHAAAFGFQVKILNKKVMKTGPDSDSLVPSGGGLALKQRQAVTETVDDFLERAQERGKFPLLCTGLEVATLGVILRRQSSNAEGAFVFCPDATK
ncbi:unnamed protein product [Ectocarpus sp. CCAP 1310/34]|nr:unnamed protein product [Ectocarpus sp. CCAP 1310/34]